MWKSFSSFAVLAALLSTSSLSSSCARPVDGDDGGEGEGEGENPGEGEGENPAEGEGENPAEGEGETPGEGEGENPGPGEGEGEGEDPDDDEAIALEVIATALTPGSSTEQMLFATLEMVGAAIELTGNANVRTGTVTIAGQNATYAAQPGNAIVLDNNGTITRATVQTLTGNFGASSIRNFYLDDHDVVVTSFMQGGNTLTGESHLDNGAGTRAGSGTLADGRAYTFTAQHQVEHEVNQGTAETSSVALNTGTLSGAGFDMSFTEASRYHAFVGTDVVEDLQTGFNLDGEAGGSSWFVDEALIKRTFRNGRAVEEDFWEGTNGTLLKDGAAFGELRAQATANTIKIIIDMPVRVEVLEEHAR